MQAVEHLDGKASRVLGAIAFLTAAAAAVFARAVSPYPPSAEVAQRLVPALNPYVAGDEAQVAANALASSLTSPRITIIGYDVSVLFFLAYIIFILLGSAFYLVAIGPHLQLAGFPRKEGQVRSLLFFHMIGEVSRESWVNHWKQSDPAALKREMADCFLFESWVLSDKLRTKESLMSIGSFLFRIALLCLAFVALGLLAGSSVVYWSLFMLGGLVFCALYILVDFWRESRKIKSRSAWWFAILVTVLLIGHYGLATSP